MNAIYVLFSTLVVVLVVAAQKSPAEIRYEWKYMNFTWPSKEAHDRAIDNGDYVPKHNALGGVKVWKDKMYFTIPRWRREVPAVLVVTSLEPIDGNRSPNVEPYPNWQMQTIGDCSAFQFPQSIEIDPKGRMWVVETGRVDTVEENVDLCPPRLVILDLEDNGKVLLSYEFPKDVVARGSGYLNDLVLDHEDGGYAYITHTSITTPSIVVFSLEKRKSWAVTHESMSITNEPVVEVKGDDVVQNENVTVDGIALSPASTESNRTVYYTVLSSFEVYTIPTSVLKQNPEDISCHVKLLGEKPSQTDGMVMSANGDLYFGLLSENTVGKWNVKDTPFTETLKKAFVDDANLMWPDSFAIDESGSVWVTSTKAQRLFADAFDLGEVNFRVVKLEQQKYKNYQYYEDGSIPELPVIKN